MARDDLDVGQDQLKRVEQSCSMPDQPSKRAHAGECMGENVHQRERALSASPSPLASLLPSPHLAPSHIPRARMGFPEFTTPAGLQSLEAHLADKSYIEG